MFVIEASRGQKVRESGGTESGGTLRTLKAASIGRFLKNIYRGYK